MEEKLSANSAASRARKHIESIRRNKFSIGENKANPLTPDLHQAVAGLSAELYAKDVHFLMELIQNAEDNVYLAGTAEFRIDSHKKGHMWLWFASDTVGVQQ